MFLWLALLIPVITAFVLSIFFSHKTKWWEFGLPFVASLIFVLGFKLIYGYPATKDSEIWNDYAIDARYYEPWNEYIHRTCSRTTCIGTGKSKICTTHFYDCSYVQYHPAEWAVTTAGRQTVSVSEKTYHYFVNFYKQSPRFVELNRHYHTIDGNMYMVSWPGTRATIEPVNFQYSYENKVQASRSVFNYKKIDKEEAQKSNLFEYPEIKPFNYPSILGDCGPKTNEANRNLTVVNAILGAKKELRIWLLCTHNLDPSFGQNQEAYWIGGNKNEVVQIVGLNKQNQTVWNHVFSWTDDKIPLIEIRNATSEMKDFDPIAAVSNMETILGEKFKRKNFDDFNYLTVEIPTWAYVFTFIVTILINIGLSYFIVINEFEE